MTADYVFVEVRGDDPTEIARCFDVLAEGATTRTPLGPATWGSPLYGMLTDRFGIAWVLEAMPSPN